MATAIHRLLTNDVSNISLHNLHLPGYSVANATARNAIATMITGDLCYQQDIGQYFLYNGSAWVSISGGGSGTTGISGASGASGASGVGTSGASGASGASSASASLFVTGTDTGAVDAWAVSPASAPALTTGLTVSFVVGAGHTSTGGAATFNYNGGGPISVYQPNNTTNNINPVANQLYAGGIAILTYDGTYWRIASPAPIYFDTATGNTFGGGAGNINVGAVPNTGYGVHCLSSLTSGIRNACFGLDAGEVITDGICNTAVGVGACEGVNHGSYNTAVGALAHYHGDASFNTAIGASAMNGTNSGSYNTAVGNEALENNTNGQYNTGIGFAALAQNTTGQLNTALGEGALGTVTGSFNTVVGQGAFPGTTGDGNTAIGLGAFQQSTAGNYNVGIGFKAGMYETGDNTFYVDNQDRGSHALGISGALIYGTFNGTPSSQTLQFNAQTTVNGLVSALSGVQPGQLNNAGFTNSAHIYSGSGVPSNSFGISGDFYFRTDTPGTASQRIYVNSTGTWVGVA